MAFLSGSPAAIHTIAAFVCPRELLKLECSLSLDLIPFMYWIYSYALHGAFQNS